MEPVITYEPVFVGERHAGDIINGVFVTHRNSTKHFFRKGRGYPIGEPVLTKLTIKHVEPIHIIETTSKGERFRYEYTRSEYACAPSYHEDGFEKQRCPVLDKARRMKL